MIARLCLNSTSVVRYLIALETFSDQNNITGLALSFFLLIFAINCVF